ASVELPRIEGFETRLSEGLGPVRERFACTLLHCPPSLGAGSVHDLAAADIVIGPVQAEYLALEGLVQFLDTLKLVKRELNPGLEMAGVLIPMRDDRTRLLHARTRQNGHPPPPPLPGRRARAPRAPAGQGLQDRRSPQRSRRRGAELRNTR